jgi:adenosylcobyric acid synthase
MTAARSALVESLGVVPSGLDHASAVDVALDEIAAELERCLDIEALAAIAGLSRS